MEGRPKPEAGNFAGIVNEIWQQRQRQSKGKAQRANIEKLKINYSYCCWWQQAAIDAENKLSNTVATTNKQFYGICLCVVNKLPKGRPQGLCSTDCGWCQCSVPSVSVLCLCALCSAFAASVHCLCLCSVPLLGTYAHCLCVCLCLCPLYSSSSSYVTAHWLCLCSVPFLGTFARYLCSVPMLTASARCSLPVTLPSLPLPMLGTSAWYLYSVPLLGTYAHYHCIHLCLWPQCSSTDSALATFAHCLCLCLVPLFGTFPRYLCSLPMLTASVSVSASAHCALPSLLLLTATVYAWYLCLVPQYLYSVPMLTANARYFCSLSQPSRHLSSPPLPLSAAYARYLFPLPLYLSVPLSTVLCLYLFLLCLFSLALVAASAYAWYLCWAPMHPVPARCLSFLNLRLPIRLTTVRSLSSLCLFLAAYASVPSSAPYTTASTSAYTCTFAHCLCTLSQFPASAPCHCSLPLPTTSASTPSLCFLPGICF